jgi:Domain of unknown function (DUF4389)
MQANAAVIQPYPVRVEGHLERPSRSSWLIKWLLALPHFVVLAVLWLGFLASSIAAFAAVAAGGSYPRSLFDFNVGVMRWSWRVVFYAYGANGTDRYPPFTLADVPDYPARVAIAYPEHQRSGLPLIGWWLAGIPQYLIAGMFLGGGMVGLWGGASWLGLIGLLVLVAAVVLLVRGTYPQSIFDLVLGLNRWVLRVLAYAAVMTTEYPPFRVDAGENDPAGAISATPSTPARTEAGGQVSAAWGPARVAATLLAGLTTLVGVAAIAAGASALVLGDTQRDAAGYLNSSAATYSTGAYALESDAYDAGAPGVGVIARDVLGRIQIRSQSSRPVFVGIAPAAAAQRYLANVDRAEAGNLGARSGNFRVQPGGAPGSPPAAQHFWVASSTGAGQRSLSWRIRSGNWRVIVMNADGTHNVASDLSIGASFPHLLRIGIAALGAGLLMLLLGGGGLYLAVRRRRPAGEADSV